MRTVVAAARIMIATLREIFDEGAYERFLVRAQRQSSPDAYAEFWRERDGAKPRPRCC